MDTKLLYLFLIFATVNAVVVDYKNYKVYNVHPVNDKDVQILTDLQKDLEYSFWTDTINVDSDVMVMVPPKKSKEFEDYVTSAGLAPKVAIGDVQKAIDEQKIRPASASVENYDWSYYQNMDEILAWMNHMADQYPGIVSIIEIGRTVGGNVITGVRIDYRNEPNATIAMIEGGIHAREWISPATVTWIIKELLTSTDPRVRFMAENIVWHIFPVTNPDGYIYTFTDNRMWRKNRNPANATSCAQWNLSDDLSNGIDLNRNFGFEWMTIGASQLACAETFAGPTPFSELEALAIANHVTTIQNQGNLVYYFAFHSYSQMILVPYSHVGGSNVLLAENYADMYEIAVRGIDRLTAAHGTPYIAGTSMDILYPTGGGSFDWVKGGANVPIVYLFELRDVGEYGFLLPTEQIIPNNEEIMECLIEMERVTREMGYYRINSGNSLKISALLVAVLALFYLM